MKMYIKIKPTRQFSTTAKIIASIVLMASVRASLGLSYVYANVLISGIAKNRSTTAREPKAIE
jgi:hypothetical protein